jgi:hypothetical protein
VIDRNAMQSYLVLMRMRMASLVAVAAIGFGIGAAGSAQAQPTTHCSAGYVSANLPWGHKCLRAGEFCKVGNKAYRRYGFVCPPTGHLRRRS